MPAIKRPNQDALYQALNIYRDAMRSFIIRNLQFVGDMSLKDAIEESLWRDNRLEEFRRALRNIQGSDNSEYTSEIEAVIDVNVFSDIICQHWDRVFAATFNDDMARISESLSEITRTRNDVAHPRLGDIPSDRAQNTLRTMARILSKAKAYEEKDEVEIILATLADDFTKEIETQNLPASSELEGQAQQTVREVVDQLSPFIAGLQAQVDELAKQTAERLAGIILPEQPDLFR